MGDGFALLGGQRRPRPSTASSSTAFQICPAFAKSSPKFICARRTRQTAEQLEAIVRNNPTNPQAYYFLGGIAFEDKKWKDAAEH